MAPRWQAIAQAVGTTFLLTSLFWFAVGAWIYMRGIAPHPAPAVTAPSAVTMPPTGQPPARLRIPVAGVRFAQLVDTFAQARADGARRHDALDIMAPRGTTVLAAAPGKVEKLFLSGDGGNTVYVRAPDGRRIYYYAHLDAYAPGLVEGETVRAGQALGTVGSTGNADPAAPHLHFAVWQTDPAQNWYDEGDPLDPYLLLKP